MRFAASFLETMHLLLLLAIWPALVAAEIVTLFGLRPNNYPLNVVSLSAGGVGSDGATTYAEDIFRTAVVYGDSLDQATTTVFLPGETVHATLVADASVYRYSRLPAPAADGSDPFGVLETCTLDGGGGAIYVAQGWEDGGETVTTTFTGAAVPFYTLTVDPGSTATSRNAAARLHVPSLIAGVVPCILASNLLARLVCSWL
ncbi:hypothetical protein DFH07DRAFT_855019 [Mycena maculata]|uniref:Uncharacterized protein n=1 Tax=Mycena maculata TaxID=230809 RepID=A0AAD7MN19_9AGAR|nr:hypothetical protein DFH07DRAFT_855019 [Mycena maculata]